MICYFAVFANTFSCPDLPCTDHTHTPPPDTRYTHTTLSHIHTHFSHQVHSPHTAPKFCQSIGQCTMHKVILQCLWLYCGVDGVDWAFARPEAYLLLCDSSVAGRSLCFLGVKKVEGPFTDFHTQTVGPANAANCIGTDNRN